jgi:phosphonoacetaldehyde hydrolase
MVFRAAERLDVYPMSDVVVVDDTPVGIEAGLNAGAWTVGVTRTGNCLGLSVEALARTDPALIAALLETASESFRRVGAHHVIESVGDLMAVLDALELSREDRPHRSASR